MPRWAARRDLNEDDLIEVAERLGAFIVIAGPLDFWCAHRGMWHPVEIKALKGRYTPYQKSFLEKCAANLAPVWTWRTEADVLKYLGAA